MSEAEVPKWALDNAAVEERLSEASLKAREIYEVIVNADEDEGTAVVRGLLRVEEQAKIALEELQAFVSVSRERQPPWE